MSFKALFSQAKARVEEFTQHKSSQSQPNPSPYAPPIPANKPQSFAPPIPPNQPDHPSPATPAYWNPTFIPSIPVSQHFKHQLGAHGWGNNELQNYTSEPANSFHDNQGNLIVRAISENGTFTSARLTSHQTLGKQRGSLTTVATSPCALGIWPAFWLLPYEPFTWPTDGEVDILESSNIDRVNHTCLHWGHFNGADYNKHRVVDTPIPDIGMGAHTHEFAWDQPENGQGGKMVWYIDGKLIMKATIPAGTRRISDFQLIINVAMGGNLCQGHKPANGWYDLVVHSIKMFEEPTVGWARFEKDWKKGPEGHKL